MLDVPLDVDVELQDRHGRVESEQDGDGGALKLVRAGQEEPALDSLSVR